MRGVLSLFGKSPFGPIQDHMRQVLDCVRHLRPLLDAVCEADEAAMAAEVEAIDRLEAECDRIKNEIRDHLPRALFLPVDRRDLLEIVHLQDSIADSLQEAAGLLTLRPMRVPPPLCVPIQTFTSDVLDVVERGGQVIDRLDELVETTFGGPEAARVHQLVDEMSEAENKSELLCRQVMQQLFGLETDLSPVEVMLWREILLRIAEVANNAERAANRLRLLIAKP